MMSSAGVPPGFRFHPTDEELLRYYLKKKVSFQKFDLEVVREVDLNKMEPWDLQERCRIGSTPQNEWYFFSHKDKKYPTGSRTNRATSAGFWKATGRDKCIRNDYEKIGMRKTLVFYQGRAPRGQKTDWIMHEYRLGENEDIEGNEDGWVICRVFKKKNFIKIGNEGSTSLSTKHQTNGMTTTNHLQALPRREDHYAHHQHFQPNLALHYVQVPHFSQVHSHLQLQSQKPPSYDFSTVSMNSSKVVKQLLPSQGLVGNESFTNKHAEYQDSMLKVGMGNSHMVEEREENMNSWTMLDKLVDSHLSHGESSKGVRLCDSDVSLHQVNQLSLRSEMDLWSFGK